MIGKKPTQCQRSNNPIITKFSMIYFKLQGPPLGPGQNSVLPGQENLNALQRAIDSMEEKGLQEDPR